MNEKSEFFLRRCLLIVTEVTIPFYTSRFNSHLLRIMLISDLEGALESVQLPKFTDETSKSLHLVTGKVRLKPKPPNSQCSTSIIPSRSSPIVINNN